MSNGFYSKSPTERVKIQLSIGFGALFIVLLSLYLSLITGIYFIAALVFMIVVSVVAPFFDVPSLVAHGNLRYHSLLFLSEKPKNGIIKIHGGTLFDYVFVIDSKLSGKQRTDFIIQQYLQGLLDLIESLKNDGNTNPVIRGTSYIIGEKTAKRMGFSIVKTDVTQKFILLFNYVNVLLSYSIAKSKCSFPNLNQTKTFETTLEVILSKAPYIAALNERLKNEAKMKQL